jgi:hypothetical protein
MHHIWQRLHMGNLLNPTLVHFKLPNPYTLRNITHFLLVNHNNFA